MALSSCLHRYLLASFVLISGVSLGASYHFPNEILKLIHENIIRLDLHNFAVDLLCVQVGDGCTGC